MSPEKLRPRPTRSPKQQQAHDRAKAEQAWRTHYKLAAVGVEPEHNPSPRSPEGQRVYGLPLSPQPVPLSMDRRLAEGPSVIRTPQQEI